MSSLCGWASLARSPRLAGRPSWKAARATAQPSGASRAPLAPVHSGSRRSALTAVVCSLALGKGSPVLAASTSRSEMEKVLDEPDFPLQWPYPAEAFSRYDESPDTQFYDSPRFVTHIDDGAIGALTKFYEQNFPAPGSKDAAILDICSSWISHYPKGYTAGRISGLGMNEEELARNPVLTDYVVKDLNTDPTLPYEDNTFDVITNAVSVDYLNKPREVFKEMQRVLKPGGTAMMSFSNRCFPTKAIAIWTQSADIDHIWIVGSYFHYTPGFNRPQCRDISPAPSGLFGRAGDPMYVVFATKGQEAPDM